MMRNLTHPVLKETAKRIREQRRAGYQEMLVGEMVGDVNSNLFMKSRN